MTEYRALDSGMWRPVLFKCTECGDEAMHVYQEHGPFETAWRLLTPTGITKTDWSGSGDAISCPRHKQAKTKVTHA